MEQANDYIKEITSIFIKLACNRRVDDAAAAEGGAGAKKKGKKGKWLYLLYMHQLDGLYIIS